ncbi:bifunctional riboflavin kinase/FAD synthetase [Sphingomonas gilva]|uniref:Riboflavin biosynthesis protein n=1 Tax=Sphingomonas gilva TaxID=2305907 RepID=A0A396RQ15_9SPHN|nr:bifunctional riboflavin kinase/FAD synthetase [Sphingomonas gilva]RHW17976.1 bifunctional riboflavin kinase/FAD synthetase [Sphingomonas gilva]
MTRLSGETAVPADYRGGIVALGNFDGFHRGHQAVVGRAVERARAEGRPAIVATFDPHPVRHFAPHVPPFRLTTLDQRERLFAEAGADAMLVFDFDDDLAGLSAEAFVTERIVGVIGAAGVVTGEDFTFGHKRGGDVAVLAELGRRHGFSTDAIPPVSDDHGPISSSRIRDALKAGEPHEAARLLTRPFAVEGVVQHGDKRGRAIGYPTANIDMGPYLRPRYGIYAVRGTLADGRVLDGAANLGIRPTFDPPKELLEPYFFDFSGDLYDQRIEVELIEFLRPEARFDSLEALAAQMAQDCDRARAVLRS